MKPCPCFIETKFIEWLESCHEPPKVKPGFDRDTAVFKAGQQSVIDFIKAEQGRQNEPSSTRQ